MFGVRWQGQPFASGSHRTGGRWNPIGTPALYLSADYNTAIAEMHQDLIRPGTLVAFDVEASRIADLTAVDPEVTTGLWRRTFLVERSSPSSWRLTEELLAAGAEGALVPSVQNRGGINLILWRWHQASQRGTGARLTLLDLEAALTGRAAT
jgi:RES domain-containing protein